VAAPSTPEKLAAVATTRALIRIVADDLLSATAARLERAAITSVEAVRSRGAGLVAFSEEVRAGRAALQDFLRERLYRHPRVMEVWRRAERIVGDLFDLYAARPEALPPEWRAWGDEAGRERAVCDYVSGMTDRFAQREHERHFGS
jgi:dGTPase